jgi:hypothetical protein
MPKSLLSKMIEHDCHYPLLLLSRLLNSRTEDNAIKKTIEDKDANFVFKFISSKNWNCSGFYQLCGGITKNRV